MSEYKAIIVIELVGGNDANNTIVPMNQSSYENYKALRGAIALSRAELLPLHNVGGEGAYGLHPSLTNVARLYNQQRASVVCNVGPLIAPTTREAMLAKQVQWPTLLSHGAGMEQWESASAHESTTTGWGGRLADLLSEEAGNLPCILYAGEQSRFIVGQTAQSLKIVDDHDLLTSLPESVRQNSSASKQAVIERTSGAVESNTAQQDILRKASAHRSLETLFGTGFSQTMRAIVQVIAGRKVSGARRQIFYARQGSYDSHRDQLSQHTKNLKDLDQGLGSFFEALDELGLGDQVLVCTHSDFNRTYMPNEFGGTDHGWGSHQLLLGGGLRGGRLLGKMPSLVLEGPDDAMKGIWIPSTSVVQFVSGIGSWLGLSSSEVKIVFPELQNFASGQLVLE